VGRTNVSEWGRPLLPVVGAGPEGSAVKDVLQAAMTVAAWQAQVTAWGLLDEVRLFTNDVPITKDMIAADFVQPTGTWYTPATANLAVYEQVYQTQDTNKLVVACKDTQFNYNVAGETGPQTIFGWFVQGMPGAVVRMANRFTNPISLVGDLDSISIKPGVEIPI
jgi:hypothetical protein